MDSRLTANFGPSIPSPAFKLSNVVTCPPLDRPDGPAAARTDHLAVLVEEDIVVNDEQPFALDEFVERARFEPDDVAGTRRNVVAPRLARIDGARRAHPVVRRRAGKHQEDVDRGRRDQSAVTGRFRIGLIEVEWMGFADRGTIEFNGLARQRVGNGLARLTRDDDVPDLAQVGMLPEVGLEGVRLP